MNNQVKKSILIGQLTENGVTLDVLGYVTFWNVREVQVTRQQFFDALEQSGLSTAYAKEHNARSALIRAMRVLRDQKIVRTVHEDEIYAVFQFTAEVHTGEGDSRHLVYHPQVKITVDKAKYVSLRRKHDDAFRKSIEKVIDITTDQEHKDAEKIKDQLAESFEKEMNGYTASDLTRYIQKIFEDNADIVSLRQQGSIYFVPAAYKSVIDSVKSLVGLLGGSCSRFDSLPMPDCKDARKAVGDSFAEEVAETLAKLDEEVKKVNAGYGEIQEKWVAHRKSQIMKIKARIDMYADILGERARELTGGFNVIDEILKPRMLDLS